LVSHGTALAHVLAAAALIACAGCSNTLTAAETPATAKAPTVAFAASESDLTPACALEGMPRVVASHVSPMAGVTAEADGSRVWLRFATRSQPRAALSLNAATLEVEDEEGAAPHETVSPAPARIPSGPVAVGVEGGRHLVAWMDGSTYAGLRVHAVTLAEGGSQLGAPIDLGFEGSAIGRPALAVTPSGRGLLAFEESNGVGFHLVVARIVCGATASR
jgi:hypothetical protein